MCGIAGIVDLNYKPVITENLLNMNKVISHRGPDDEGYVLINQNDFTFKCFSGEGSSDFIKNTYQILDSNSNVKNYNIGLCHRRFSIIDLTTNGHQPFFDKDKSCCIVYNGEIYNYLEIRNFLKSRGIIFFSNSDTEVILEAYKFWNEGFLEKLNGFWAFALYDFRVNKLFISRDRVGKKPLYYTTYDQTLYFSSEIKSLLQVREIKSSKNINETAIASWLYYSFRDLNFQTCFKNINSIPQASFIEVNSNFQFSQKTFWNFPQKRFSEKDISIKDACINIKEILTDAVKIRLRADVPLCVELSGGLDSSVIVALASQISKNKISTYTVKFLEKKWDEEHFAKLVAQKYNVDYNVLNTPTDSFWSLIHSFTFLEEEPYHSPNLQTNQMIWGLMREHGMKVSLNGAAGDELFAGYGDYFFNIQVENLSVLKIKDFIKNLNWTESANIFRSFVYPFYHFYKNFPLFDKFRSRYKKNQEQSFIHLFNNDSKDFHFSLSKKLIEEMEQTKIPYWLRSGDKGYMGVPLEVRAPFLDYRIIEYVMQLPINYLIKDGWHKWILRKSLVGLIPDQVLWRRNKLGFPFHYETFFEKYSRIINLILNKCHNPYLDLNQKGKMKNNWKIISFILWYEFFFNENYELFDAIKELAITIDGYPKIGFKHHYIQTYEDLVSI